MRGGRATPKQFATAWLVVVILLGVAGLMGWRLQQGLAQGVSTLPISRASWQRPLARAPEPVAFWAALGFYGALGVGATGAALWLGRETRRVRAS